MTSLHVSAKPKLFVCNENGMECFYAPEEKNPMSVLVPTGLKISNFDKEVRRVNSNPTSVLLHGVEMPITAFTPDGNILAVFDNGKLSFFNMSTNEALVTLKEESLGRIELMSFSPLGTYLVTWSRVYKGDKNANLVVYRVNNGTCIKVLVKYFERRQPIWPSIRFTQKETLATRMINNAVQVFEDCAFDRKNTCIKFVDVAHFSLFSSNDGLVTKLALFKPEDNGGGPARVNIYEKDGSTGIQASKSFFKAQNIEFHWSPNGKVVLLQTHTDTSSETYYGESNLYLLHTDGSYDCIINRTKNGPLHAVAWSPKGNEFTVIAGNFPANITVYNPKTGAPYFELGAAARNTLCYSPHGRFLCVAGFGSLRGDMDFWDMNKRKMMGKADGSCSITYSWSPCGRWFATGSTYPRMQVDNCYKIFKYNGNGPICEVQAKRLFDVSWVPALQGIYPDRPQEKKKKKDKKSTNLLDTTAGLFGTEPFAEKVPINKHAYRPPGARDGSVFSRNRGGGRSLAEMLGETGVGPGRVEKSVSAVLFNGNERNIPGMTTVKSKEGKRKRKKRNRIKVNKDDSIDTGDKGKDSSDGTKLHIQIIKKPSEMTPEELAKSIKKMKKKLKQIEALKERRDKNGEKLNADQNEKISNEKNILQLVKEMESVIV